MSFISELVHLDHDEFCDDVGRPLERKRTFRHASMAMHSALDAIEDGSMDWDLMDKKRMFDQIQFLVKYMEHINDGLRDLHYMTRGRDGRYLSDPHGMIGKMHDMDKLIDCITPREYRD